MTSSAVETSALVEASRDPHASIDAQQAAFSQLVERSRVAAFGLAVALLRELEEAKDVTQDAYTTAWIRLAQLRDASAFGPWLNTIVRTECNRRLRRRIRDNELDPVPEPAEPPAEPAEHRSLVSTAIESLSVAEREVTVLCYLLGYSQKEAARLLNLKPGTIAKRLFSARLRIRRQLPGAVRREFIRLLPARTFADRVRSGILDEYVGKYRFDQRPEMLVTIAKEGDRLISTSGDQQHVLAMGSGPRLLTTEYDGEGEFIRNRRGRITHFVYYEFGKRLGIARKI